MRTIIGAVIIGAAIFGAVLLLTGDRSGSAPGALAAPQYVQRDRGEGGVEVEVTYVTPEYVRTAGADIRKYQPDTYTVFLIAMNTHSVDLAGYDMTRITELRAGGTTYAPLRWESTSDNNHHRSGALIFPGINAGIAVELVVKNIAGVPARTFRWTP